MELDQPDFEFKPPTDRRPTLPEPPPVRVVAVEDVVLLATAEQSAKLDRFYVGLLRFEREGETAPPVYRAENVRLRFNLADPGSVRDDLRILGIDLQTFGGFEKQLIDSEIPFAKERGLTAGQLTYLLQDPAGNWVRVGQIARLM